MSQRHYSHRAGPIDRCMLCFLFRLDRQRYRHRRGMLGPLLYTFLGIPERRTNYRQYRYYAPERSSRRATVQTSGERATTLAERHATTYRRHSVEQPTRETPSAVSNSAPRSRRFQEPRPSARGVRANYRQQPTGNQRFQPLPRPTGQPPYHLSLESVLPADQMAAIRQSQRILMHILGDTGGVKAPQSQQIVAMQMEFQFQFPDVTLRPAFFYHLGDVIYYYGEADEYYPQFYEPYVHYPAPIFAIPGNHDGDVVPDSPPSLTAFVENFCATTPHVTQEAGETNRDAMTQPNVYWTLEAPFVTIIGLYSNVPEGGQLDNDQVAWFVNELRTAPTDKALIVAVHHPPYSADQHHSGSKYIEEMLDHGFNTAGRMADAVFAGHVHNYQRFTREVAGRQVPYIVAGAGGYWHLHYIGKQADGSDLPIPYKMPDSDVTLESQCDDRHGFMRVMVTPQYLTGEYWTVSRPQESWRAPATRIDGFALDLRQHQLIKGTNPH